MGADESGGRGSSFGEGADIRVVVQGEDCVERSPAVAAVVAVRRRARPQLAAQSYR